MSLKVTFPAGSNSETVRGLYQWDYGQVLEIESADIGSEIVEVHFACLNMNEAIVRSCAFSDGVGSVTIPDACLEQSTPVTAWIYQISGTQGHTSKTIILPITARTRPSANRDIPAEVSDKYTELITAVNENVGALKNGNITAAKAIDATNANHATSAGNAATANYATSAGRATQATTADKLTAGYFYNKSGGIGETLAGVDLEVGRAFLIAISIGYENFTLALYVYSTGSVYSTATYNGYYCVYNRNTKTLSFYRDGAAATPSTVYIRAL